MSIIVCLPPTATLQLPWLLRFLDTRPYSWCPPTSLGSVTPLMPMGEPEEPICDCNDLRQLANQGVSVQSHGASHRRFSDLDPTEQEEELRRSKVTLETGLGKHVEVFSYPYGDDGVSSYPYGGDRPMPQVLRKALKRVGYRACCLYGGGSNRLPVSDPYRLARLAMGPDTDLQVVLG
jgi:hypothetical protein